LYVALPFSEPARLADQPVSDYYQNMAASAQKTLEDIGVHLVRTWSAKTGLRHLCLAGGVALNCRMHQTIRESADLDGLFVPPHSSDAGLSVGAALLQLVARGQQPKALRHAYLGPEYQPQQLRAVLEACGAAYDEPADLEAVVADDLEAGRIVGWFQGRMEFGPRALGSRSILADPRRAEMKDLLNHRVKYREPFRPFTPSVLDEAVAEYFEQPMHSPFMTITFRARPGRGQQIPAVVHDDGTVRVQSVTRQANPRYHRLISQFAERTGVPVLLNTSLNVKGQPICCGPREALSTYFTTGMDCLALGPYYLRKR
jgi:carbamoyltransferase